MPDAWRVLGYVGGITMRVHASTVQELIDALNQSGVTEIDLDADKVYTVTAAYSQTNALPSITDGRPVKIYGNNATIERDEDSEDKFRFFYVENAKLTLNGIAFRNGLITTSKDAGGAVLAVQTTSCGFEMEISIIACTFHSNSVDVTSGESYGGALAVGGYLDFPNFVCRGLVFICNSIFHENYAEHGGALHIINVRNASVQGTSFISIEADKGGAIHTLGGPTEVFEISDCRFSVNTAANQGGAIANHGCDMRIVDSIFTGNEADSGAAVFKPNSIAQFLVLENCSVSGNVTSDGSDVQADSPAKTGITAVKCWWGLPMAQKVILVAL